MPPPLAGSGKNDVSFFRGADVKQIQMVDVQWYANLQLHSKTLLLGNGIRMFCDVKSPISDS